MGSQEGTQTLLPSCPRKTLPQGAWASITQTLAPTDVSTSPCGRFGANPQHSLHWRLRGWFAIIVSTCPTSCSFAQGLICTGGPQSPGRPVPFRVLFPLGTGTAVSGGQGQAAGGL